MKPFAPESVPFLALPWLRLQDRKRLPDCAAIYFVCDAQSKVLYIGQTTKLSQRWMFHNRLAQCRQLDRCRIAWLEVTDSSLLPAIEEACIAYFCPPWNGQQEPGALKNVKVTLEMWKLLRLIAASTGEQQRQALMRMLTTEWQRLQHETAHKDT